jgi:hypothetical protein
MLHRTFWTQRRFTGIVLIVGGVLFLGSAWIPLTIGPPTPLTDSKGTFIYSLPPRPCWGSSCITRCSGGGPMRSSWAAPW